MTPRPNQILARIARNLISTTGMTEETIHRRSPVGMAPPQQATLDLGRPYADRRQPHDLERHSA